MEYLARVLTGSFKVEKSCKLRNREEQENTVLFKTKYTVKKGLRFSRLQPGCH